MTRKPTLTDALTDAMLERDGYLAGLNLSNKPGYTIYCPYDGRTRAGKAWWAGFLRGDSERVSASIICTTLGLPEVRS